MKHITPLHKELNKLNNDQLIKEFYSENRKFGILHFFPVFAKRIKYFKDLVLEEAISKRNIETNFRSIKPSWLIVISVLDYCENETFKNQLVESIKKYWSDEDYNSFLNYISEENNFTKFFKPT